MKDGFNLMYIKDGIIYPVVLTVEQDNILQNVVPSLVANNENIRVVKDRPLGEAVILKQAQPPILKVSLRGT